MTAFGGEPVLNFSFQSFVDGDFDCDEKTEKHTGLHLREESADIGGGKIRISDIDELANYPNIDTVTVSGLTQDTFEYFINTYGKQLKAIRFFKNKQVEDLSLLGTLPQLEYLYFFANQRVTRLWNMSKNTSLTGICINDFTKLKSIDGIETAPNLRYFEIGNEVWAKAEIESLKPLANTKVEYLSFTGKKIRDNDFSFLSDMPKLKEFDFALNLLTTEQVAWIVANFPNLKGFALKARHDCELCRSDEDSALVPAAIIVGKGKPSLKIEGNEELIRNYELKFEFLVTKYKGKEYSEIFKCRSSACKLS